MSTFWQAVALALGSAAAVHFHAEASAERVVSSASARRAGGRQQTLEAASGGLALTGPGPTVTAWDKRMERACRECLAEPDKYFCWRHPLEADSFAQKVADQMQDGALKNMVVHKDGPCQPKPNKFLGFEGSYKCDETLGERVTQLEDCTPQPVDVVDQHAECLRKISEGGSYCWRHPRLPSGTACKKPEVKDKKNCPGVGQTVEENEAECKKCLQSSTSNFCWVSPMDLPINSWCEPSGGKCLLVNWLQGWFAHNPVVKLEQPAGCTSSVSPLSRTETWWLTEYTACKMCMQVSERRYCVQHPLAAKSLEPAEFPCMDASIKCPGHTYSITSEGLKNLKGCDEVLRLRKPFATGAKADKSLPFLLVQNGACLDAKEEPNTNGGPVHMSSCATDKQSQKWVYNPETLLIRNQDGICLHAADANIAGHFVQTSTCDAASNHQQWIFDTKTVKLKRGNSICIESAQTDALHTGICDPERAGQQWEILEAFPKANPFMKKLAEMGLTEPSLPAADINAAMFELVGNLSWDAAAARAARQNANLPLPTPSGAEPQEQTGGEIRFSKLFAAIALSLLLAMLSLGFALYFFYQTHKIRAELPSAK